MRLLLFVIMTTFLMSEFPNTSFKRIAKIHMNVRNHKRELQRQHFYNLRRRIIRDEARHRKRHVPAGPKILSAFRVQLLVVSFALVFQWCCLRYHNNEFPSSPYL